MRDSVLAEKVYDYLHAENRNGKISLVYGDSYYLRSLCEKYGEDKVNSMIKKMK